MRVNARKGNRTMADLNITNVSLTQGGGAVANITHSTVFSVDVSVTALAEDFNEGVAYSLYIFVTSLVNGGLAVPLINRQGHLQDPSWPTSNFTFNVPVTAGPTTDVYNITLVLLEGPTGAGGISFASGGPLFVL